MFKCVINCYRRKDSGKFNFLLYVDVAFILPFARCVHKCIFVKNYKLYGLQIMEYMNKLKKYNIIVLI